MKKTALTILAVALTLATASAQSSLEKGLNAEQKGLTDLALKYYFESADTDLAARRQIGLIYEKHERYHDAEQWLAKADSSITSMAHLAACRAELGEWQLLTTMASTRSLAA